ncbi:hypothetical protein NQ318_019013, partial [Aromia moschata]
MACLWITEVIHVLVRCVQLKELLLLPKVCVKIQETQLVTEHNNLIFNSNFKNKPSDGRPSDLGPMSDHIYQTSYKFIEVVSELEESVLDNLEIKKIDIDPVFRNKSLCERFYGASLSHLIDNERIDKRKAWILKLRIGKPVSKCMRVCSLHFAEEDSFYR